MVILTTIYVAVAVLLLFASAIFIHEWGHFFCSTFVRDESGRVCYWLR
jgi:hypothetical protein